LEGRANNHVAFKLLSGTFQIPQESVQTEPARENADLSKDEPEEDVLEASTNEICHSISSLFRLSVAIQNLSSQDQLERMARINMSHFETPDINHVRDKFRLTKEGDYLSEKLGKANTKRRQLLEYNEMHHEKLVGRRLDDIRDEKNKDEGKENDDDAKTESGKDVLEFGQQDYMSQTASSAWDSTASTVNEEGFSPLFFNRFRSDEADDDNESESGFSQTSNAAANSTALFEALERQDIESVKLAMTQKHFDVNAYIDTDSEIKETALMYACTERHNDIVKLLLDHTDILINLQDKDGWTALMNACYEAGGDETAIILLERNDI
jgi:hypothetical protein